MSGNDIAGQVERQPAAAQNAFARLDGALNLVLPGSDTHERYRDVAEVGLAAVIGREVLGQTYSPFDPATLERLSFRADNRQAHPQAWEPKASDESVLGGAIPAGMGRFTAYALAKINAVSTSTDDRSYREDKVSIEPGKVGIAGGLWEAGAVIGVSGLWEVHDHIAARLFVDEFGLEINPDIAVRTVDDLAGEIESILGRMQSFHKNVQAADLDRRQVAKLLLISDGVVSRLRSQRAEDLEE